MKTIDQPSDDFNYNSVFQSGKRLAELLDVSPAAITSAVKKGHNCCGYPVAEWAEFSDSGRTEGYHVPNHLIEENEKPQTNKEQTQRANPEKTVNEELNSELVKLNLTNNKVTKGEEPDENVNNQENRQPEWQPNYSILPENQDYARPATTVALSSTVNTALKQDTPQSRAVIAASVAGLGALTGQMVSDSAKGAAVGATIGMGVTLLAYWLTERNQPQQIQKHNQDVAIAKQDLIDEYFYKQKMSGYVN